MIKFNKWFNKNCAWFFTNGSKSQARPATRWNTVTRIEVFDVKNEKCYVNGSVKELIVDFQDNGKTLKVFVK
jgi:hypothetical protein